jgi:hypothetical protein
LIDKDGSSPLCNAGVEALSGAVWTQEQTLDRLEQTIIDLDWLMDNANKNHEEEKNLPRDSPRGGPNLFLNLMRFRSMMRDFLRKDFLSD